MSGYGGPYVIYPNWNAYAAHTLATARNALEERERRLSEERARRGEHQGNAIKVDAVELYSKDNAKHHHTEMFDSLERSDPPLIIRRGQPFLLAIRFKREYQPGVDDVSLDFSIGPNPEISKGTFVSLHVPDTKGDFGLAPQRWDVRLTHHDRAVICVQVFAPANVSVGLWRVAVLSWSRAKPEAKDKYRHPSDIYVLFNPWCKDDLVYMDNEDWRREYVLNDVGKVYVGSSKQPWGRHWIFGQFEVTVLPKCSLVLDKSELSHAARADPVKVVRAIAAVVNSNDEGGIVTGNWSGNYEGGISPSMWTGSSAILEQYVKNGGTSVNYGQCWVFAAVCNTVCRALGIPCRPVTCFESAHDTDETLTIDRYFDEEGKEVEGRTTDSIWNFHVWNEVWMARKDLPPGYGGWQVIDPTPQERSRGFYQLGPCSVMAVKKGEVGYNYDSRFVFAEVNADVIHWKRDPASDFGWSRSMTLTYQVGRALLTKKADVPIQEGIGDAEDITHYYKDKEGSEENRRTVLKAVSKGVFGPLNDLGIESKQEVSLKVQDIGSIMIGKPFTVTVSMRNDSWEQRTIYTVLSASSVYYTGILADNIKLSTGIFVLRPQQEEVLTMTVQPEEYLNKLVDFAMGKIYVYGNVKETGEKLSDEDDFTITTPKLDIQIDGPMKVGHTCKLLMSFKNPLNVPLRDCALSVGGIGFTSEPFVPIPNVAPRAEFGYWEMFEPVKSGPLSVVAVFSCRELSEIPGFVQMVVEESPAPTFGGAPNHATAWLPRFHWE